MRAPKLLPWIARKAGITDELALKLWRRAAAEAEERTGEARSSEYFGFAVERFLDLVESESTLGAAPAPIRTGWMWRHQKRMALHSLTATHSAYRWWENLRRRLQGPNFTAP